MKARAPLFIPIAILAVMLCLALAPAGPSSGHGAGGPWHVTELISVSSDGEQGEKSSGGPQISDDGRFVLFQSNADNLVPNDNDSGDFDFPSDIFLRDRITGTTSMVSLSDGEEPPFDNVANNGSISGDGVRIAFVNNTTLITNLGDGAVPQGLQGSHLYVRDREDSSTRIIDKPETNDQVGDRDVLRAQISGDGKWIVFETRSANLVPNDNVECPDQFGPLNCIDAFLVNVDTGDIELISRASSGEHGNDDSFASGGVDISADGRYSVYTSTASNLVPGDTVATCATQLHVAQCDDVFLFDAVTKETTLVSRNAQGEQANTFSKEPAISANGRYIAYVSAASNLVSSDTNGGECAPASCEDIFRFDRETGETILISANPQGQSGNGHSYGRPGMSADGRYVAFQSSTTDLVGGFDTRCHIAGAPLSTCQEVYVRDTLANKTAIVSVSESNEVSDYSNGPPDTTADGFSVVFTSGAQNLHPDDHGAFCPDVTIFECLDIFAADASHPDFSDLNCDGIPDVVDALQIALYKASNDTVQHAWCPPVGDTVGWISAVPQGGVLRLFGDLNCSGVVDMIDLLTLLRFFLLLDPEQEDNCPSLGELPGTPTTVPSTTPTPTPTQSAGPGTPTPSPTKTPKPSVTATVTPVPNECSQNYNFPIPNGDGDFVQVDFPPFTGSHTINGMALCLNVDHEKVGDLVVTLVHEDTQTSVKLVDRIGTTPMSGNCSGNAQGLYILLDDLEDETITEHCTSTANSEFAGAFKPDNPLSAFDGESVSGTWRMTITDEEPGANTGFYQGSLLVVFYDE